MIAIRDLQIGDFINTENNGVVQITVLSWRAVGYEGGASTPEHCSYIPLTEDILVKNGWRKEPITIDGDYANWHGEIPICQEEDEFNYERIELIYVHQLQHLLRLCGIEKEIGL